MAESLPNKKLQGKVAIITGGASGIGEAISHLFADHGAHIIIADIQDHLGHRLSTSIGPHRSTYIHCDVTDETQLKSLIQSTLQNHGHLDVMVSNAGILGKPHDILDIDLAKLDKVLATNVRGMVAAVKHAARAMVDGGVKGSIVCMASVGASVGVPRYPAYGVSKHAVLGLVRSACSDLGVYGIRVNCVSPSVVDTPMTRAICYGMVEKAFGISVKASLRGVELSVTHVAEAALFLACDDSAFVSGHNLVVDGGFLYR